MLSNFLEIKDFILDLVKTNINSQFYTFVIPENTRDLRHFNHIYLSFDSNPFQCFRFPNP